MSVVTVTNEDFNEVVLKSEVPVIVDFYADWCQPCKRMSPILDQLSEESGGAYKVCKLNTDENPDITNNYRVMGIPCFISFKDGQEHKRAVGVVPKESLAELVSS